MKALCRHRLDFSMFSGLYGCCLQQQSLPSVCGDQPIALAIAMGVFMGLFWHFINVIKCNPLLEQKVSFGGDSCVVGACLLCYIVIPFRQMCLTSNFTWPCLTYKKAMDTRYKPLTHQDTICYDIISSRHFFLQFIWSSYTNNHVIYKFTFISSLPNYLPFIPFSYLIWLGRISRKTLKKSGERRSFASLPS